MTAVDLNIIRVGDSDCCGKTDVVGCSNTVSVPAVGVEDIESLVAAGATSGENVPADSAVV